MRSHTFAPMRRALFGLLLPLITLPALAETPRTLTIGLVPNEDSQAMMENSCNAIERFPSLILGNPMQPNESRFKQLQAVIFDWSGTLVDFGSLAPTQIFVDAFASFNIPLSLEQARGPMGLSQEGAYPSVAGPAADQRAVAGPLRPCLHFHP